ncbi:hypothetical protein [Streptomyces sp. Je 1-4 4N24_ara]|uniref:hypothetical protein n=1 Tax=Streptomyces TaxID=1883 RepID=UPI0034DE2598
MGIRKTALRQRGRLAVLRPRQGAFVLQSLLWRDEVREPGDLGPSAPGCRGVCRATSPCCRPGDSAFCGRWRAP